MVLEQKLQLKLTQKLVMTPTLQQAIKLLQLSRLELEQALGQELQANPLLEATDEDADEEAGASASGDSSSSASREETGTPAEDGDGEHESAFEQVEIEALFANYLHDTPSVASTWDDEREARLENSAAPEEGMFDQLCEQLRLFDLSPELQHAAVFVAGNLESDGYLRVPAAELAEQLGADVNLVEEAIRLVQQLEPPGIGARSLQECLLLQLERLEDLGDPGLVELALRIVTEAFDDLLHQRWDRIRQAFGTTTDRLRAVLYVVRRLELHPGSRLGPTEAVPIEPDVTVRKVRGQWQVTQDDDGLPRLRLSARYLRLLQSRTLDGETSGFLRERMRAALWFLRSVEQRQNTILKVSEAIVRRQEGFLEQGVVGLRPLVLRDIADDIGMHESTVSRVVANKYIATPRGILPLKFFFHSAISHAVKGDISSVVVKERIRELIDNEETNRPLSDARIARQLNRLGIRIARRTVAKYREELRIPSSEQRRRVLR
jgi:RNA polymerase sigma-54 factor